VGLVFDQYGAVLGEVTGRPVTYRATPAMGYVAARTQAGMPEPLARVTGAWFQAVVAGELTPTDDIERLIGRATTPLQTFLIERRSRQLNANPTCLSNRTAALLCPHDSIIDL
jgi:NAD(P)H dehydrogenase (quinone)